MLYADKVALANRARLRMLEIRERELELYTRNSRAIGTQCAMLAGIGYTALVYTKMGYYQQAHWAVKHLYPVALSALIGIAILTLQNLVLISMLGPGLALRGPDGSVHVSIESIMIEYRTASFYFGCGIILAHVVVIVYAWGDFDLIATKVAVTLAVVISLYIVMIQARHVNRRFYFNEVHTGAFYPTEMSRSTNDAQGIIPGNSRTNGVPDSQRSGNLRWAGAKSTGSSGRVML